MSNPHQSPNPSDPNASAEAPEAQRDARPADEATVVIPKADTPSDGPAVEDAVPTAAAATGEAPTSFMLAAPLASAKEPAKEPAAAPATKEAPTSFMLAAPLAPAEEPAKEPAAAPATKEAPTSFMLAAPLAPAADTEPKDEPPAEPADQAPGSEPPASEAPTAVLPKDAPTAVLPTAPEQAPAAEPAVAAAPVPPAPTMPPPVFATPPAPPVAPAPPTAAPVFAAPAPPNPFAAPTPSVSYDYGYGYQPATPACRVCGGMPAVETTVHGHQGLVVVMRFLRQPGPYCRVCGTATVRHLSQYTLLRGWWAYLSPLFTLIALLRTRSAYQKIRRLPEPVPGTHGPQLDPGKPLTKRGAIWMLLLPVAALVTAITLPVVLLAGGSGGDTVAGTSVLKANGGDCLSNFKGVATQAETGPDVVVVPCTDKHAQYQVLGRVVSMDDPANACSLYPAATSWYQHKDASDSFVLCLAANTPGAAPTPGSTPDDTSGGSTPTGSSGSSV
ncbi:LppU/SCO3897 family protein [Kitasatospora sp. LaBMicrA B282]|uniref:LppU/SCO3897 family protein n=1 Tax=Kitasatospora sp. LaBMicrA B282 TaxID=3420949 RepID=UPI003D0ACB45